MGEHESALRTARGLEGQKDRSTDPASLLAARRLDLPRTDYCAVSRIKLAQAIVILCTGTKDDALQGLDTVTAGGVAASDTAGRKRRSWAEAKLMARDKLVEEQLAATHKEYSRLIQAHGGQRTGAKGSERQVQPAPQICRATVDPLPEYVKNSIIATRKLTTERIVFHYIYHRAPSVAALRDEGQLLLYCQDSNEHKPLPLKFLHEEVATPTLYIFDCPHAGRLVQSLDDLLPLGDDIVALGACGAEETFPWDRLGLPIDLFTACLHSPIRAALNFYALCGASLLSEESLLSALQMVTGKLQDRSTPLGELVSIFTAVTDAIAWSSFKPHTFKRLFREDGALAELVRNFLLAQRILYTFGLQATSRPELPPTHRHHLWDVWDSALEVFLVRLAHGPPALPLTPQPFFDEQLAAFWVWLRFHPEVDTNGSREDGAWSLCSRSLEPPAELPVELPIVLQGLLHPGNRLEALRLLVCFVDMGVWAVHFTLLVGARPYLTKLLAHEDVDGGTEVAQRALLVWTKMLAFDSAGKAGILGKDSYRSFLALASSELLPSYQRAFASFCLAIVCRCRPAVQLICYKLGVLDLVAKVLVSPQKPLLRWMIALLCAEVCRGCPQVSYAALHGPTSEGLLAALEEPTPEVRASAVYAIGCIARAAASVPALSNPTNPSVAEGTSLAGRMADMASTPNGASGTAAMGDGLEEAVPLYRRFLGLGPSNSGNDSFKSATTGSIQSSHWLCSSMVWHFCHKRQTPGPVVPDCGILNETSMFVRYELVCVLVHWLGDDLTEVPTPRFVAFDSLPRAPWAESAPLGSTMAESHGGGAVRGGAPVRRSASCFNFADAVAEAEASVVATPQPIVYDWTIDCLQHPNALCHAMDHDAAFSSPPSAAAASATGSGGPGEGGGSTAAAGLEDPAEPSPPPRWWAAGRCGRGDATSGFAAGPPGEWSGSHLAPLREEEAHIHQ